MNEIAEDWIKSSVQPVLTISFDEASDMTIQNAIRDQANYWEEIASIIGLVNYKDAARIKDTSTAESYEVTNDGALFTIRNRYRMPMLLAPLSSELKAAANSDYRQFYELMVTMLRTRRVAIVFDNNRPVRGMAMSAENKTNETFDAMQSAVLAELKNSINHAKLEINAALTAFHEDMLSARRGAEGVTELAQTVKEAMAETEKATKEQVDRLRHAQDELATIRPIVSLWKDKQRSHAIALGVSALVFVLVILMTVGVLYYNAAAYVAGLVAVAGGQQIVVTGLIVAPVLGVAWILRIISRFIVQNMTLTEDARQRGAVAATFIGLIAERDGVISVEERALALNALFRPPAGSGENDVIPPNLLDLINSKKE